MTPIMTTGTWGTWMPNTADTTSTTSDAIWWSWTDSTSAATTVYRYETEQVWQWWMQQGTRTPAIHVARPQVDPRVAEAARQAAAEKQQLRKEVQNRAEALLRAHLNDEQLAEYRDKKRFHVVGQDGERYRIDATRRHQNIRRIVNGKAVEEFCIYMTGIPLADNLLAQKMMLECDVAELKRIANKYQLNPARTA